MKHILLTFLILISIRCSAQNPQLILTENANDLWFELLNETNELSGKIKLINQRLSDDADIYIKWEFPDNISVQRFPKLDSLRKIRTEGCCKPLYVVKFKSEQIAFRIENPIKDNLTNSIIELINEDNIRALEVWTDDERQALYGTSADCGVIFLKTEKRKVFKAFKRLELTSFYMDEIRNY